MAKRSDAAQARGFAEMPSAEIQVLGNVPCSSPLGALSLRWAAAMASKLSRCPKQASTISSTVRSAHHSASRRRGFRVHASRGLKDAPRRGLRAAFLRRLVAGIRLGGRHAAPSRPGSISMCTTSKEPARQGVPATRPCQSNACAVRSSMVRAAMPSLMDQQSRCRVPWQWRSKSLLPWLFRATITVPTTWRTSSGDGRARRDAPRRVPNSSSTAGPTHEPRSAPEGAPPACARRRPTTGHANSTARSKVITPEVGEKSGLQHAIVIP